jgi:hypothetical protein
MDDDEYLEQLVRDYGSRTRKSNIRSIANAIYEFLEEYHIDLSPMERERLSLYLVHYADSKKAAAHIKPIHPGIKKIPKVIQKISDIIEEATDSIADQEFLGSDNSLDEELNKTLDEKPTFEQSSPIQFEDHNDKLSKIKSFNKGNKDDEDEE